jgi:flagellar biosynthesis protein FlhF
MRVKRYVAGTVQEALEKIRVDLGKDAVILNTKTIRTGGFLGLFKKVQCEVIAAVDQDRNKDGKYSQGQVYDHLEQKRSMALNVTKAQNAPVMDSRNTDSLNEKILDEVKEMRGLVMRLMKEHERSNQFPEVYQKLVERLRQQEVAEELIHLLVQQAMQKHQNTLVEEKEAQQLVRNEIIQLLRAKSIHGITPMHRMYHFVGPTGVGKTTTIAKLAAHFVLNQQKKVGFITSDTFRIAAIDQLKTYANILNAPIEVVFNPRELHQSVMKLAANDYIFMDTAGRNFRENQYIQELSHLLHASIPAETFLVLSLSAKYADMVGLIQEFAKIGVNKVIFTKLDETDTYGSILNINYFYNFQLSYITNGQNVPDDILPATPELIADLILGRNMQ